MRAPGEGERAALRGYAAQLKVGASHILQAFEDGVLDAVAVADPKAGRIDDIQLLTNRAEGVRVDAFQVKWSGDADPVADAELRRLISDAIRGRKRLRDAWRQRRAEDEPPVARIVAHVYTNRPVSTARLKGEDVRGRGLTMPRFIAEVWRPAAHGAIATIEDVPPDWRQYVVRFAREASVNPAELLAAARDVRLEFDRQLPEDADIPDFRGQQWLKDVLAFAIGLLEAVTDDRNLVVLRGEDFLELVGDEWLARWRPRSAHVFPVPSDYQPMDETREGLAGALDELGQGYLVVTGSPGSGKSTMLTRELRSDPRLVARYYAFVPDGDTATRGEAYALLHDLLLALDGRSRRRTLAPPQDQEALLLERLQNKIDQLGTEARAKGSVAVILIDGLDHVLRDPAPSRPFLNALLPSSQIPDGVLFVLGTRNVADLPAHLQAEARLPGRHIRMAPMDRRATLRLAALAGLDEATRERVWRLSEGHPLLSRTFTMLAAGAQAGGLDVLAGIPQPGGQVMRYYESVWGDLHDNSDLVALLGLICRLRGPIDLNWLQARGVSSGLLERLGRLEHLFRTSSASRWYFFHDSFREFLRGRTTYRLGSYDVAKERSLHATLAEWCAATPPAQPQAWEELHHRLRAGDMAGVTEHATPEYFRAQLEALRPPEDVAPDISEAAAALAVSQDAVAAVRLMLAASECRLRNYQQVVDGEFLRLLLALGDADAAISQLARISNSTAGTDRVSTALEFVVELHDHGLETEAARLFAEYEPIELLDNRTPDRDRIAGHHGPWRSLYAWAGAAVVVHGPEYVIEQIGAIVLTQADVHPTKDMDEATALAKSNMLLSAAEAAEPRLGSAVADTLLSALPSSPSGQMARAHVLLDRAYERHANGDVGAAGELVDYVLSQRSALSRSNIIAACEMLLRLARVDEARPLAARLPVPVLPGSGARDEDIDAWRTLLRELRVRAAIEGHLDPTALFALDESKSLERWRTILARHLVVLANLWGRHIRGEPLGTSEITRLVRTVLGLWDSSPEQAARDLWTALPARRALIESTVILCAFRGNDALDEIWRWWLQRWAQPGRGADGGMELVATFSDAGLGPVSIRSRLQAYTDAVAATADAETWIGLALAWIDADDPEHAETALERSLNAVFTMAYRRDYQLTTWIELLRPLLQGPAGGTLATWLTQVIRQLKHRAEGGVAHHAARGLVRLVGQSRPRDVVPLARRLLSDEIFDVDDVVECLLEATAAKASVAWWTLVSEVLVPLGGGPVDLEHACASLGESSELTAHLRRVAERVAVEGRPSTRVAWRQALVDAGAARGITRRGLGITAADLDPRQELALDDREERKDPEEGDSQEPVEELLTRLEAGDRDYVGLRPAARRVSEMDEGQRERLAALAADDDASPAAVYAGIAAAAHQVGQADIAWTWAVKALETGSGSDWQTRYDGGPTLQAIRILRRIDAVRARPLMFRRLGTVAAAEQFMLSSMADELDEVLDVFAPYDEIAVAREILKYVADMSRLAPPELDGAEATPVQEDVLDSASAELVAWLLSSTHLLGWSVAQRASLSLLRVGGRTARFALAALIADDAEIPPERLLALFDVALADGVIETSVVAAWLQGAATSSRLDVRQVAVALLRREGLAVPAVSRRKLPPALRVAVSRAPEPLQGAATIGAANIDEMLDAIEKPLQRLAVMADVDSDALEEHVRAKAAVVAAAMPSDQELAAQRGVLGWGYVRPSAIAVDIALAEAAAELVDAGLVAPAAGRAVASMFPKLDPELLRRQPEHRPTAIGPSSFADDRRNYFRDWLEGTNTGPTRLAMRDGRWKVIAEVTELIVLDHRGPREEREQGLMAAVADGQLFVGGRGSMVAASRPDPQPPRGSLIVRTVKQGLNFADGFVALHPGAATVAGLKPGAELLSWALNGQIVVRSIWWRSGFAQWQPYSNGEEVGDGWLVVANADGITALVDAFPDAAIGWSVARRLRAEDENIELPARVVRGARPVQALDERLN